MLAPLLSLDGGSHLECCGCPQLGWDSSSPSLQDLLRPLSLPTGVLRLNMEALYKPGLSVVQEGPGQGMATLCSHNTKWCRSEGP